MEQFTTLIRNHIILSNLIVYSILVLLFLLARRYLLPKKNILKTVTKNNQLNQNDTLENYTDIQQYNDDTESVNLPEDIVVEITDPILKDAIAKMNKNKVQLSESRVVGTVIYFKDENDSKLKLLKQTPDEQKESIERLNKSSFGG